MPNQDMLLSALTLTPGLVAVVLGTFLSWPVVERWLAQSEIGEATRLAAALVPAGMMTSLVGGSVVLAVLMVLMARDVMTE